MVAVPQESSMFLHETEERKHPLRTFGRSSCGVIERLTRSALVNAPPRKASSMPDVHGSQPAQPELDLLLRSSRCRACLCRLAHTASQACLHPAGPPLMCSPRHRGSALCLGVDGDRDEEWDWERCVEREDMTGQIAKLRRRSWYFLLFLVA